MKSIYFKAPGLRELKKRKRLTKKIKFPKKEVTDYFVECDKKGRIYFPDLKQVRSFAYRFNFECFYVKGKIQIMKW